VNMEQHSIVLNFPLLYRRFLILNYSLSHSLFYFITRRTASTERLEGEISKPKISVLKPLDQ
jgi:hypothetical protein